MDCFDCLYRTRNSVLGLRKSNAEKDPENWKEVITNPDTEKLK